jgi:dTDP-4-dehydrorhamnose 3,5-epimerase
MIFHTVPLEGAYLIQFDKKVDDRGFFSRIFCVKEFSELNLETDIAQVNVSFNHDKGTLRGMHYQLEPSAEAKIVRCIRGSIFDVIIDMRPGSKTFKKWYGEILSEANRKMLYVPKGFAHGFLTLEDNTEIVYLITEFYDPKQQRGLMWNDPEFNIQWPFQPKIISDQDKMHPKFDPAYHLAIH